MKKFGIAVVVGVILAGSVFAKDCVFIVSAHPDDIECCLGLMLRMKDKYDLQIIDFTRGEGGCGQEGFSDGTTAVKRIAEEREVCKAFGCEPIFLSQVNRLGRAYAEAYVTGEIEKLLLKRRPKAVFVNWPIDGHPDHVQCAAATMHAIYNVKRDCKFVPELYFYEELPTEVLNFRCDVYYVDVSEQIDAACDLIRKYECQKGWKIADNKRRRLASHGADAPKPVRYAEVYTTLVGDPMPGGVLEEYAIEKKMKPVKWTSELGRLTL